MSIATMHCSASGPFPFWSTDAPAISFLLCPTSSRWPAAPTAFFAGRRCRPCRWARSRDPLRARRCRKPGMTCLNGPLPVLSLLPP